MAAIFLGCRVRLQGIIFMAIDINFYRRPVGLGDQDRNEP